MTIGVYCIRNIINDKRYIGSSANIEQRWRAHRHELRHKNHHSIHLQRAWDKYGESNFEFTIIKISSLDTLISLEQELIDLHKSSEIELGYNISPTAESCLGVKRSDEFKRQCTERNRKRYEDPIERAKTGAASKKAWTPDIREKASNRMREKWANPEIKETLSQLTSAGASRPDRVAKRSARMFKKWEDPQARQAASSASPNKKRIQHIETGMIYESISQACGLLPVSKQTIKNNLLGKFKSAKGMNFRYV